MGDGTGKIAGWAGDKLPELIWNSGEQRREEK
jgi:hypothetical protein